jgi:hypothetical protein
MGPDGPMQVALRIQARVEPEVWELAPMATRRKNLEEEPNSTLTSALVTLTLSPASGKVTSTRQVPFYHVVRPR